MYTYKYFLPNAGFLVDNTIIVMLIEHMMSKDLFNLKCLCLQVVLVVVGHVIHKWSASLPVAL